MVASFAVQRGCWISSSQYEMYAYRINLTIVDRTFDQKAKRSIVLAQRSTLVIH